MTGNKPFTYGSVCSGIEAATVAWHSLGWSPSFFSEIDKFPRALLQHHYPHVPLHGDFTTIGENDYETIDLLVGGTPCQAFSVAGLRKGFADKRGNLTLEFIRLAQRKKPRWLVWENVPGVLSQDKGRAFGAFLGGLAELGYGFAYRILDAQYFGVPQRRRRVFVVGYLGDWRPAAAVLFERESLLRDITPSQQARQGIAGTIGARTGRSSGAQDAACGHMIEWPASVAPTLDAHYGDKRGQENQHINGGAGLFVPHMAISIQDKATRYKGDGNSRNDDGSANGFGVGQDGDLFPTLDTGCNHAVAVRCFKGGQGAAAGGIGYDENLSPTLGAADSGSNRTPALMAGMQVRRLTPVECERLQGFPDDYTNIPKAADGNRYKALGNSMAVPVMRWLGDRIKKVERLI